MTFIVVRGYVNFKPHTVAYIIVLLGRKKVEMPFRVISLRNKRRT